MADMIAIDVAYTSRAIDAMLQAYPELLEDAELRLDTLEGETDLNAIASRLVQVRGELLAHVDGLEAYIGTVEQRRSRKAKAADSIKAMLLRLMATAQTPKLNLPEATVSVQPGRKSVSITDLDAIPQGYFKLVTEKRPDKDAIRKSLEAKEHIPGAALVTGENTLVVRTK